VIELGVADDHGGQLALVVEPGVLATPDQALDGEVLEREVLAVERIGLLAPRRDTHLTLGQQR
jgi:hypothetical protein